MVTKPWLSARVCWASVRRSGNRSDATLGLAELPVLEGRLRSIVTQINAELQTCGKFNYGKEMALKMHLTEDSELGWKGGLPQGAALVRRPAGDFRVNEAAF